MHSQEARDAAIRKARAALELHRRAGTEAEALAAMEAVGRMMSRYNLEMYEIDKGDESAEIEFGPEKVPGKYNEKWRRDCYSLAAQMYFCHYFFNSRPGDKKASVIHTIIGEPHNVLVAVEMGKYFEDTINRLANEASRLNPQNTHTQRHQLIRSFRQAAVNRLSARVYDYIRRAKAGQVVDPETGSTLPSLINIFQLSARCYEDWKKENNIDVVPFNSRVSLQSELGAELGHRAGERISLTTQIAGGSKAARNLLS